MQLCHFIRRKGKQESLDVTSPSPQLVLQALERNFNGLDDLHSLWESFLDKVCLQLLLLLL